MSKAFTKDDDAPAELVVPRRAPLPAAAPNYVTPRGLELLERELSQLVQSTPPRSDGPVDVAHAARLAALEQRIASAVVVESHAQPKDEVRFGASVEIENQAGVKRRYRIVGVDEANAGEGAIAFVAPLARALLGKRVGEVASFVTPSGEDELEILAIRYD